MTLVVMLELGLGLAFASARFGVDPRDTRCGAQPHGSWVGLTS